MRINLGDINRDEFVVDPRHHEGIGTLVLVRPKKNKMRWQPHELWLRSLLCREDGEVVSCGLPKFFNYGENAEADAITDRGIANGEARSYEKVDGSLIIRSVVDGVVILRTRGSHDLGRFEDKILRLCARKYWRIFDPDVATFDSLLFEFVDPSEPVCLRYPEPALYYLGSVAIWDDVPSFWPADRADASSSVGASRPAGAHVYKTSAADLRAEIAERADEGVVVATMLPGSGYHLSKFKSRRYLALHALRTNLTERRAWVYFARKRVTSEAVLRSLFALDGIDWEVGCTAAQWLPSFLDKWQAFDLVCDDILAGMSAEPTRKGKAAAARAACDRHQSPELFTFVMATLDRDPGKANTAFEAAICGLSVSEYKAEVAKLADLTAPVAEDGDA